MASSTEAEKITKYLRESFTTAELTGAVAERLGFPHLFYNWHKRDKSAPATLTVAAAARTLAHNLKNSKGDGPLMDADQMAALELLLCQKVGRAGRKTTVNKRWLWRVMKLTPAAAEDRSMVAPVTDLEAFIKKVRGFLSDFNMTHVAYAKTESALWVRASDETSTLARATLHSVRKSAVTVALLPHSPHLLIHFTSSNKQKYMAQALMRALDCSAIEMLQLKGFELHELMDLIVHHDGNGAVSKYRLNQVDANPLLPLQRPKRTFGSALGKDGIVVEDAAQLAKRQRHVEDTLGTNPLPKLTTVTFKLLTQFHGTYDAGQFHCQVRLKGTNVAEGVRALIPAGIAVEPLPEVLSELGSALTTEFVLRDEGADEGDEYDEYADVMTAHRAAPRDPPSQGTPMTRPTQQSSAHSIPTQ